MSIEVYRSQVEVERNLRWERSLVKESNFWWTRAGRIGQQLGFRSPHDGPHPFHGQVSLAPLGPQARS